MPESQEELFCTLTKPVFRSQRNGILLGSEVILGAADFAIIQLPVADAGRNRDTYPQLFALGELQFFLSPLAY